MGLLELRPHPDSAIDPVTSIGTDKKHIVDVFIALSPLSELVTPGARERLLRVFLQTRQLTVIGSAVASFCKNKTSQNVNA